MMWDQSVVKGTLTGIGEGIWLGDTFKASFIEIGGQNLSGIRVARCLLDHMKVGEEMELLICSEHIYGVRVNGEVYKEGVLRQLGWALLAALILSWVFLPLVMVALIFVRRSFAIYMFPGLPTPDSTP